MPTSGKIIQLKDREGDYNYPITLTDAVIDSSGNLLESRIGNARIFYGTCNTSAGTQTKSVTCPLFTQNDLVKGALIFVTFKYTNTYNANSLKMNVNSTGAKSLFVIRNDSSYASFINNGLLIADKTYLFSYDGTSWVCLTINDYKDKNWISIIEFYGEEDVTGIEFTPEEMYPLLHNNDRIVLLRGADTGDIYYLSGYIHEYNGEGTDEYIFSCLDGLTLHFIYLYFDDLTFLEEDWGGDNYLGNEDVVIYQKPSAGIPSSDLTSSVQSSLTKADSAIQTVKVNGTALTPDSNKAVDVSATPKVATSTTNAIAKFGDTNGTLTNSGVTIDSSNQVTAAKFITSSGTSSQFVKGDGSLDSTTYAADNNVVHKSGAETIGGVKTFNSGLVITINSAAEHLKFGRAGWNYISVPTNGAVAVANGSGGTNSFFTVDTQNKEVIPGYKNGIMNLGSSSYKWKDLYLSGTANATTINSNLVQANKDNSLTLKAYTQADGTDTPQVENNLVIDASSLGTATIGGNTILTSANVSTLYPHLNISGKADDNAVVHLANAETITGEKTFQAGTTWKYWSANEYWRARLGVSGSVYRLFLQSKNNGDSDFTDRFNFAPAGLYDIGKGAYYVAHNWPIQNNNSFRTNERNLFYISKLDNLLYAARKRFVVTWYEKSSTTNEILQTIDTDIFDCNYEHYFLDKFLDGTYSELYIGVVPENNIASSSKYFYSYMTGRLLLSFYSGWIPESLTVQYMCKDDSTWRTLTMSLLENSKGVFTSNTITGTPLNVKAFKITFPGKTFGSTTNYGPALTQVEFVCNRHTLDKDSSVTKYAIKQDMYGDVVAPIFAIRDDDGLEHKIVSWDDVHQVAKHLFASGNLLSVPTTPSRTDLPIVNFNLSESGKAWYITKLISYKEISDYIPVIPGKSITVRTRWYKEASESTTTNGFFLQCYYYDKNKHQANVVLLKSNQRLPRDGTVHEYTYYVDIPTSHTAYTDGNGVTSDGGGVFFVKFRMRSNYAGTGGDSTIPTWFLGMYVDYKMEPIANIETSYITFDNGLMDLYTNGSDAATIKGSDGLILTNYPSSTGCTTQLLLTPTGASITSVSSGTNGTFTFNGNTVLTSGNNISLLTNDSGYITSSDLSGYATLQSVANIINGTTILQGVSVLNTGAINFYDNGSGTSTTILNWGYKDPSSNTSGNVVVLNQDTRLAATKKLYITSNNGDTGYQAIYADSGRLYVGDTSLPSTIQGSSLTLNNGSYSVSMLNLAGSMALVQNFANKAILTCSASGSPRGITSTGYQLKVGNLVLVTFDYGISSATNININSTGSKKVGYKGADLTTSGIINNGDTALLMYDGTRYNIVSVYRAAALIDSPIFTGTPQAPTPTTGDNSDKIATTSFVTTAISNASISGGGGSGTDTKNTAGATSYTYPSNTTQKFFIIGSPSLSANPLTYSFNGLYLKRPESSSDPQLYINDNAVVTSDLLSSYQTELTFDSAPLSSSSNPVTSSGIYTALAGKLNTKNRYNVSAIFNTNIGLSPSGLSYAMDTMISDIKSGNAYLYVENQENAGSSHIYEILVLPSLCKCTDNYSEWDSDSIMLSYIIGTVWKHPTSSSWQTDEYNAYSTGVRYVILKQSSGSWKVQDKISYGDWNEYDITSLFDSLNYNSLTSVLSYEDIMLNALRGKTKLFICKYSTFGIKSGIPYKKYFDVTTGQVESVDGSHDYNCIIFRTSNQLDYNNDSQDNFLGFVLWYGGSSSSPVLYAKKIQYLHSIDIN